MINEPKRDLKRYLNKTAYDNMPDHTKKQLHEAWRQDPSITVKKIKTELKFTETKYYDELKRLGVPYRKYTARGRKNAIEKKSKGCCEISFNGTYEPQQLLDYIDRIKETINPGAMFYEFAIKIKELAE